jgi:hypothetical protein
LCVDLFGFRLRGLGVRGWGDPRTEVGRTQRIITPALRQEPNGAGSSVLTRLAAIGGSW